MVRRRVDLPQPDGPINDTNSPLPISRSIPLRATVVPDPTAKVLPTPARLTTGWRSDPVIRRILPAIGAATRNSTIRTIAIEHDPERRA